MYEYNDLIIFSIVFCAKWLTEIKRTNKPLKTILAEWVTTITEGNNKNIKVEHNMYTFLENNYKRIQKITFRE